jgi:hypothetical protein
VPALNVSDIHEFGTVRWNRILDASGELLLEYHDERPTDRQPDLAIDAVVAPRRHKATTAQLAARLRTLAADSRDH